MTQPPIFKRGPRQRYRLPTGEIVLVSPEQAPTEPTISWSSLVLPPVLTVAVMALVAIVGSQLIGSQMLMLSLVISMPLMLIGYLVSFLNHYSQKRAYKAQQEQRDQNYRNYLQRKQIELKQQQENAISVMLKQSPNLPRCQQIAEKRMPSHLWSRDAGEPDFLHLRLGLGTRSSPVGVIPPEQDDLNPDPLIDEAIELASNFSTVDGVPVTVSLADAGILGLVATRSDALETVNSLIIKLTTHHSPLDVRLVVIYPETQATEWAWMRWLPHAWSNPNDRNRRYLACGKNAAHRLLDEIGETLKPAIQAIERGQEKQTRGGGPAYLFVIADSELVKGHPLITSLLNHAHQLRAYSLFYAAEVTELPSKCKTYIQLTNENNASLVRESFSILFQPDRASVEFADHFSRCLAPLRIEDPQTSQEPPRVVTLTEILGVDRMEDLDVLDNWQKNNPYHSMSVPIGKGSGGQLQYLDPHDDRGLKRSQRYGHGPHGLGAGIVGSGKGVLIQSVVASLAANFHPHRLNFVLLDFKEGATSKPLLGLPHVVNEITNRERTMIPRVLLSIMAEYKRRAVLIRGSGCDHIDDYMKLYDQGAVSEILPYLIIVIDEFKMLLDEFPELAKTFIPVAVKGRWTGLLMMLFNQQLSGVVSPFIENNTNYRLCLRVADVEESRTILGGSGAEALAGKGQAILQVTTEAGDRIPMKFQSAWSTAPYLPRDDVESQVLFEVALDGQRQKASREAPAQQLSVFIKHVAEQAAIANIEPYRKVWLDSLPTQFTLDSKIEDVAVRAQSGWDGAAWRPVQRWLSPIIGLQDDPENQQRLPLQPDLSRSGHLFICSNQAEQNRLILRTLVMSLVLDHTPKDLNIYCLDLGSFGLQVFKDLFHVGAVIQPNEPQRIRRLFRFLLTQLESRKNWLAQKGLPNLASAHQQQVPDCPPALVIIIDNVSALDGEYETDSLLTLLKEGQGAGIHFIIADVKGSLTGLWKIINVVDRLRIALQLTDREDYAEALGISSGDIRIVVPDADGRGLCKDGRFLECQVALPIVGQTKDLGKPDKALVALVKRITQSARAAGFEEPIEIGSLTSKVTLRKLIEIDLVRRWSTMPTNVALKIPIGIDDLTLRPMIVNLTEDGPHFFVTGPKKGGKTTALYAFVLALATLYPKEVVQFIVFDRLNGKLASLQMLPHTRYYVSYNDTEQIKAVLQELRQEFEQRQTAKQERPALVLVADEYEFFKSDALKDILSDHAQHDTISGFHVILSQSATNLSGWDKFRTAVLSHYSGLVVGSVNLDNDAAVFDYTFPIEQKRDKLIPGRAFLFRHRQPHLVQVATPGDQRAVQEWVKEIAAAAAEKKPLA